MGGGYAGLAVIISLRGSLPAAELHLIDPRPYHIKLTQLHQTLHTPLAACCRPFAELAERFNFTHHPGVVDFSEADLLAWQDSKCLPAPGGPLPFDYLVLATGARSRPLPRGEGVFCQEDFYDQEGQQILMDFLNRTPEGQPCLSVVGAGATGLQFLFELDDWFKSQRISCRLRLISRRDRLLPQLPPAFQAYVSRRLNEAGIEYCPHAEYVAQEGNEIRLKDLQRGGVFNRPSGLTLLFPGVVPYPRQLQVNRYGRVMVAGRTLDNIFAAGDCSLFSAPGLNDLTAQAAVRKGKLIATNIRRFCERRLPYLYAYGELGYFLSLGFRDGIGWLLFKRNILTGLPALAVVKTLKVQYDLFLDGLDLYV